MDRGKYDGDANTWSPSGRLYQIEYSLEAVKQGGCTLGLRGKDHVVLCGLKRAPDKLASPSKKIFRVDDHIATGICGLTADGRSLVQYMRGECLNHKYAYDSPMVTGRLVGQLGEKAHHQSLRVRAYGVGLLVGGYDADGPHLYDFVPVGRTYEYEAYAIGARQQASKTYLEKNFDTFKSCTMEELITHAVKAIKPSLGDDVELTSDILSVVVIGKGQPCKELTEAENEQYIQKVKDADTSGDVDMGEA